MTNFQDPTYLSLVMCLMEVIVTISCCGPGHFLSIDNVLCIMHKYTCRNTCSHSTHHIKSFCAGLMNPMWQIAPCYALFLSLCLSSGHFCNTCGELNNHRWGIKTTKRGTWGESATRGCMLAVNNICGKSTLRLSSTFEKNKMKKDSKDKENSPDKILVLNCSSVCYSHFALFSRCCFYSDLRQELRSSWWR